jgi:hypothetical protein
MRRRERPEREDKVRNNSGDVTLVFAVGFALILVDFDTLESLNRFPNISIDGVIIK